MTGRRELARTPTVTEVRRGPNPAGSCKSVLESRPCMEKPTKLLGGGYQDKGEENMARKKKKKRKKRAKETERTFCDWNSERSSERCKGPREQGDRVQASAQTPGSAASAQSHRPQEPWSDLSFRQSH